MQYLHTPVVVLPLDVAGVNLLEITDTNVTGIDRDLVLEDVDDLLDTLNTVDVGVHERTAKTNSLDTERQKLEDVSTVADTTVSVDLNLLEDLRVLLVDLKSDLERRGAAIDLTTTVVGDDDSGDTVLNSELSIGSRVDTLEDDGKLGHLLELLVVVPGDVGVVSVGRTNTEAGSTVTVTVGGRVNGEDNGSSASLLRALEELLSGSVVVSLEVELLEDDLTLGLGLGNLLNGKRGVESGHVEDITLGSTLHQVLLSLRVSVTSLGSRTDEEGSREVVAQDGSGQSVGDVGDINHDTGLEAVTLESLEVVTVRPLASGTVTVVGEVLNGEVVLGSPLEVRETNHGIETGKLSLCEVSDNEVETSIRLVEERSGSHGPRDEGRGEDLATHGGCEDE